MKKVLAGLVFMGAIFLTGASARSAYTFKVTFYDGDPSANGEVLTTVNMNTSPIASVVDGDEVEGFEYITISDGVKTYTFETFPGGSSKYSIYLDQGEASRDDATSLTEMLDTLAAESDIASN